MRPLSDSLVSGGVALDRLWSGSPDLSGRGRQEMWRNWTTAQILVGGRTERPGGLHRTQRQPLSCVSTVTLQSPPQSQKK